MPTQISTNNLPTLGFRNKLINGNFDFWQRGTSFSLSAQDAYTADRWKVGTGNSGTATVTRQAFTVGQTEVPNLPSYYIQVHQTNAGVSPNPSLFQKIEHVETLAGKTVTVSWYAKASSALQITPNLGQNFGTGGSPSTSVLYAGTAVTLSTSWTKYSQTFTLNGISGKTIGTDINDHIYLSFSWSAAYNNVDFYFAQVQVEEGSVPTAFDSRHYQQEMTLCQRFYEKSYNVNVAPGSLTWQGVMFHIGTANGEADISVSFKTPKRSLPTITTYAPTNSTPGNIWSGGSLRTDASIGDIGENGYSVNTPSWAAYTDAAWQWTAESEL